jgi:hypothetical protein
VLAAVALPTARAQYSCTGVSETKNTTLSSVVVAAGLAQPVFLSAPPGDAARVFIHDQGHRPADCPASGKNGFEIFIS